MPWNYSIIQAIKSRKNSIGSNISSISRDRGVQLVNNDEIIHSKIVKFGIYPHAQSCEPAITGKEMRQNGLRRLRKYVNVWYSIKNEGENMEYPRAKHYSDADWMKKIMGPNPLKLEEELLTCHHIKENGLVCDLGSGQGLTSVFLVKEYGFRVVAADLWSDPDENRSFFRSCGLSDDVITPVKADALALPFEKESFDAVISTDSYNYFGRDKTYLNRCLYPYIRHGGYVYICVPGMHRDLHENLPAELLLSWTPEQMDYMHDTTYWKDIVSASMFEVLEVSEMESNEEVWADWLRQENPYAIGDRKSMNAGAGKYLNFIKIVLKKP